MATVAVAGAAGKVAGAVTVQVLLLVPPAGMVTLAQVLVKPGGRVGASGTTCAASGGTLEVTSHVATAPAVRLVGVQVMDTAGTGVTTT